MKFRTKEKQAAYERLYRETSNTVKRLIENGESYESIMYKLNEMAKFNEKTYVNNKGELTIPNYPTKDPKAFRDMWRAVDDLWTKPYNAFYNKNNPVWQNISKAQLRNWATPLKNGESKYGFDTEDGPGSNVSYEQLAWMYAVALKCTAYADDFMGDNFVFPASEQDALDLGVMTNVVETLFDNNVSLNEIKKYYDSLPERTHNTSRDQEDNILTLLKDDPDAYEDLKQQKIQSGEKEKKKVAREQERQANPEKFTTSGRRVSRNRQNQPSYLEGIDVDVPVDNNPDPKKRKSFGAFKDNDYTVSNHNGTFTYNHKTMLGKYVNPPMIDLGNYNEEGWLVEVEPSPEDRQKLIDWNNKNDDERKKTFLNTFAKEIEMSNTVQDIENEIENTEFVETDENGNTVITIVNDESGDEVSLNMGDGDNDELKQEIEDELDIEEPFNDETNYSEMPVDHTTSDFDSELDDEVEIEDAPDYSEDTDLEDDYLEDESDFEEDITPEQDDSYDDEIDDFNPDEYDSFEEDDVEFTEDDELDDFNPVKKN